MQKAPVLLSILFAFIAFPLMSQHATSEEEAHAVEHWRAALLIGHTFVPAGEAKDHLAIPSWGVDLEYWVSHKWGLGLHSDLEIQSFIVERDNEELLEREYPAVLTMDVLFKPWRGLAVQAGPGIEIEPKENFFLVRFGIEYEFEVGHGWDIAPNLFYDTRSEAFDTWSIALGVGKRF
ncbi:MAG: hypothetical protein KDC66_17820 [Phaeodactylibacter sp.]|nr:hypothetical protein [Phaeodactylibacter sp.]MCB9276012.1 hypothetical protein [Lewinellaceae bacterium]